MSILFAPHFHNEDAARERLEEIVWPHGPVCPRCSAMDRITVVRGGRPGLRRCGACDRQFTVTVGTLFERSKVPLHKWFQAAHLLASSQKGISAHQLHRTLQVQYKTAWSMEHRLRGAMRSGPLAAMGGADSIVEVDETLFRRKPGVEAKGVYQHCAEKHLHRYLAEFVLRYSNRVRLGGDDEARASSALRGITGKRLAYRDSSRDRAQS